MTGTREEPSEATAAVRDVMASTGQPLPAAERTFMEGRFGHDFSHVRIHADGRAAASARALGAHAYTVGHHVAFDTGRYSPQSAAGRYLLAHELSHVIQQRRTAPLVQRWSACSAPNLTGNDCPERAPGERQRSEAGLVFLSHMRDPESGQTGALIANFAIGKTSVSNDLKNTSYWRAFLRIAEREKTRWKIVGFSDCHEAAAGAPAAALRKQRAEAAFHALPKSLQSQVDSHEAAPDTDCMRPNVTPADRAMNRSVAFILTVDTVNFAEDAEDAIVGKTPQNRVADCQAGGRVKTFPFRTTRFGGAPIMAHRDGDAIVVKLPLHVKYNSDFRRDVSTLPDDSFLGGTQLDKSEIVRVRRYQLRHWYNLNVTGDASNDETTDYCVPAEKLLDFAHATNMALVSNLITTGVEGLTAATPIGKLAAAGVSKLAAPVGRNLITAGMLGLSKAAPSATSIPASALISEQVGGDIVAQSATRALASAAVEAPVADVVAPRVVSGAASRISTSALAGAAPTAATVAGSNVAGGAVSAHVTDAELAGIAPAGNHDEGVYATAQRLIRGNAGERLAADVLVGDGDTILFFKPSILGTNQGGIDIVTMRNGVVNFIDNKALSRSGNIASVSALTTNFSRNMADMVTLFRGYAADPARSEAERQIFRDALGAIARGSYERVVTNANIMSGAVPSGITQTLGNQGIRFRNVLPSMTDLSPWNR